MIVLPPAPLPPPSPVPVALDCWVASRVSTAATGDSPATAALRQVLTAAERLMRADRAINALPGLRAQVTLRTANPSHPDGPLGGEAIVGLHRPRTWGPTGCTLDQRVADYMVPFELKARLNDLTGVLHLIPTPQEAADFGQFPLPPVTGEVGGHPIYAGRVVILTPPGLAPFVPVRVREHLAQWDSTLAGWVRDGAGEVAAGHLAALRAHRAALSPAALDAPLALGPDDGRPWGYVATDAPDAVARWRVNPALWRGARPGAVRAIALELFVNDEGAAELDALHQWLPQVDVRAWAALLAP